MAGAGEEDILPGTGAAAEARADDTPTLAEAIEALREVREEEGEADLWGFTRAELETCLKVVHALRDKPKLFLESPTLGVTGIQWLLNRKRMCVADRAVWGAIDKSGNKNRKKERKYNDNQKLAQTQLRVERESALRTLIESGDGSDTSGKICSSAATPIGTLGGAPLAITTAGEKKDDEDEVTVTEKKEKWLDQRSAVGEDPKHLNFAAKCYTCKAAYHKVHQFYFALCPPCAELNYSKRQQTADLRGRFVLLTGSRIKIGQQICLSLLRCGATVIATTRFPADMSNRYSQLQDYEEWKDRLHIYRLDLRNLFLVTRFARFLKTMYPALYAIVNNAAQTVARPQAYYANLLDTEESALRTPHLLYNTNVKQEWDDSVRRAQGGIHADNCPTLLLGAPESRTESVSAAGPNAGTVVGTVTPKEEGKWQEGEWYDMYDTRQIARDRRTVNSWTQELHEIDGTEAAEVHAINALAPFILDSELRDLLRQPQAELGEEWEDWEKRPGQSEEATEGEAQEEEVPQQTPTTEPSSSAASPTSSNNNKSKYARLKKGKAPKRKRFIINVSAMEGQFYRYKTAHHPHTNMAKASLNMLTRTAGAGYAMDGIYMNSVDTGWITDENPLEVAIERHKSGLQCPLDEIDAAARVLDLIYIASTEHGKFWKDYHEIPW